MAKKTQDPEEVLAGQIPEFNNEPQESKKPKNAASEFLGTRLTHKPGVDPTIETEHDSTLAERKHLSRIGDKIETRRSNAEYHEGWLGVDRELLGERSMFYPSDWQFMIKPATVEAIRNWSTLDETNFNSIDDVFNEILKSCLAIKTNRGPLPWYSINRWDRLFFVLLIREYTFEQGEQKVEWTEECLNCEGEIKFVLSSQALQYDTPDPELYKYYDQETRSWMIDPTEYEVEGDPIVFYNPTLEREANIKAWWIDIIQKNANGGIKRKEPDRVFLRFLPWMTERISKDPEIAQKQIRILETKFKDWDIEMFSLADEIIRNIDVEPEKNIIAVCPSCGEEVTSPIRFPNGIASLFNVVNRRKKFGKK